MDFGIRAVVAVIVGLLPGVGLAQVKADEPIKTTLCDLVQAPERFNGKMVQVRAEVNSSGEGSVLFEHACSASILLVAKEGVFTHGVGDKQLGSLMASLKKYPFVMATVTGRYDHLFSAVRSSNMFDSRFLMWSVSDVVAKRMDSSVPAKQ